MRLSLLLKINDLTADVHFRQPKRNDLIFYSSLTRSLCVQLKQSDVKRLCHLYLLFTSLSNSAPSWTRELIWKGLGVRSRVAIQDSANIKLSFYRSRGAEEKIPPFNCSFTSCQFSSSSFFFYQFYFTDEQLLELFRKLRFHPFAGSTFQFYTRWMQNTNNLERVWLSDSFRWKLDGCEVSDQMQIHLEA